MTASLAGFIASPDGELYGRYCTAYGKDPGAIFADDVIAFQVGVAYMMRGTMAQATPADELDAEAAANERAWLAG